MTNGGAHRSVSQTQRLTMQELRSWFDSAHPEGASQEPATHDLTVHPEVVEGFLTTLHRIRRLRAELVAKRLL
jgi:hypothetical protein